MRQSNKDIIGAGGYGTVYRMEINASTAFAVKRLNRESAERDQGFERELEAMGDINIVTLHGYYTAPHYNLLIYELMPNGSLAGLLHEILKSSNILLDKDMEARVSDFGLATLMEPDKSHVSTLIAGTFGYLAPEYFDTGKATAKGDVYSFGVVFLELLTGKKPTNEAFIEEGTKLVSWVGFNFVNI
ncbi:protein kinase superfamily protein [Actinidia rufa]|uniref:Protein kinase superfamily protein n=1 Tax=Actinidia rufa TaxID=165716 RepID=A0A7J0GYG2_9ERIC|nr:protein kinase superfamily protein [Actinidia rufa]